MTASDRTTTPAAEAREMLRRRLSIRIGSLASYAPVRRLWRRTHSPYQSTSPTTALRAGPPSRDASQTRQACLAEVTRCFTRAFVWNAPLNSRGNGDFFVRSEPCNRTPQDPGWRKTLAHPIVPKRAHPQPVGASVANCPQSPSNLPRRGTRRARQRQLRRSAGRTVREARTPVQAKRRWGAVQRS